MPRPDDKKAVQRLLGCVNYLSRFMATISEVSEPLRKLTEKNAMFVWESQQEEAFQTIKNMISSTPVLKYYDVAIETTIQCDASESGLGAALLQNGQPVAFAPRLLSAVERRYAQIKKECLVIVFAYSRFNQYLHGREHQRQWIQTTSRWYQYSRSRYTPHQNGCNECSFDYRSTIFI